MNSRGNDTAGFPQTLTAETLRSFITTERGCTHPRVGEINDGRRYIAKCGIWSAYSSDEHVSNELAADAFLREAGLNVPASREYRVDFGADGVHVVRLAEFKADAIPLGEAWDKADDSAKARIREQVLAAYPYQALIAGIDTFTWDNVKVDPDGNLWFVDNGASFDFRACGKRKGWFWTRSDVDHPLNGYLSLANHPNQLSLRTILGLVDGDELWASASKVNFSKLVSTLPESHRKAELEDYAAALDKAVAARTAVFQKPTNAKER